MARRWCPYLAHPRRLVRKGQALMLLSKRRLGAGEAWVPGASHGAGLAEAAVLAVAVWLRRVSLALRKLYKLTL